MPIKIVHEHFRRMTSRGWLPNALLILCFFAVLVFLNLMRNTSNDATEVVEFLHIWENTPEPPRMKVISIQMTKNLRVENFDINFE